jgi:cellulose synthase operon protein C
MKHMSRRFAAVALVALAVASCSRDPQKQAEKYVASGDAYVARKQFNQAAIEYKNAVKAKPERADIHYKLAKVYEAQADPGKAYQEYARTADLEPSNLDAQLQAGMLLLSAGEFEAARTRAELALKAAPDSAPANILLGNALSGLNEPAKAIKQIEQALSPANGPARPSRKRSHWRRARWRRVSRSPTTSGRAATWPRRSRRFRRH